MAMYGQYCPISRSVELLGDRWMIHIVRDLLTGTTRFNELIRGNPGLSRSLLSRRLRELRAAGLVEQGDDGSYRLTEAGRDLEPVVFGLAAWGARWTFGEPTDDELDPDLLLWWLHRRLDPAELPTEPFVAHVSFTDHAAQYWIVVDGEPSLWLTDPGLDVDVTVLTDRRTLYRIYLGHVWLTHAHRVGAIEVEGPASAVRAFTAAFRPAPVADLVAAGAP